MKEFDEDAAAAAMKAAIAPAECTADDALEVLDIVYDYYEEHGDLDVSLDDDDDEEQDADIAAIVEFVVKQLRRRPARVRFDAAHVEAMVRAEIGYEESLME